MTYVQRVNKHQLRSERTRQKIMDAAEVLFAPSGSTGVSMRQIAAAVGVDLSLVTYHFESKDALYHAVIDRLYLEFTNRRTVHLDALEDRKTAPAVTEVFDVLITSWFELVYGAEPHRARLLIRGLNFEYNLDNEAEWISDPFAKRFLAAVRNAAPGFPTAHVHWTYHFFTGAIVYCMNTPHRVRRLSSGICNIDSRNAIREALLGFVEDAFQIGTRGSGKNNARSKPVAPRSNPVRRRPARTAQP